MLARMQQAQQEKIEDYELATAHLLPKDPVAKKRASQKCHVANLSDVKSRCQQDGGASEVPQE